MFFFPRYPLVIQHTHSRAALELLLLQDAFKILHPLLQITHVSRQVAVEEAHRVSENHHACTYAPFIPLRQT